MQAIHGGTATAGCPSGETLSASIKTDGNGKLRIAVPYGTWAVKVTSSSRTATSGNVVASSVVVTPPSATVAIP